MLAPSGLHTPMVRTKSDASTPALVKVWQQQSLRSEKPTILDECVLLSLSLSLLCFRCGFTGEEQTLVTIQSRGFYKQVVQFLDPPLPSNHWVNQLSLPASLV